LFQELFSFQHIPSPYPSLWISPWLAWLGWIFQQAETCTKQLVTSFPSPWLTISLEIKATLVLALMSHFQDLKKILPHPLSRSLSLCLPFSVCLIYLFICTLRWLKWLGIKPV
jgi:hypothetical protein